MKCKFFNLCFLVIMFNGFIIHAQEKTINGTVTDESGPLPGVSILIKGTQTGTETDFDGNYAIATNVGDVLVYSFIGMKTEEKTVGTANTINIVMVADNVLDEVVVTALGIKREKKSIGYAQQSVKGEDLTRTRETDLGNALAGKVAGVQFVGAPSTGFGNSQIRLRGRTGTLYIVDGIKMSSVSDVNVDNIEEMSILKGAAATALYGPQGANGVILITTMSAKNGQSDVTVNHSTALENLYLLPEYQNEYGGGYSQNFNTFNFNPATHPAAWSSFDGQPMVEYYADESWGPKLDGQLVRHWDSWIQGDPEFGQLRPFSPNPDNIKNFFDTGVTNNTSITYSKGGEGYSVYTTIANIDRTSISPNSDRNTLNASINASLDITDKITAYAHVNYQDRKTKNFPANGYSNLGSNFNQWWQRQLDMDRLRNYRRNGQLVSWNINSPTNTQPLYWDMPFFTTQENLNFQDKNGVNGKFGLSYEISESLNASVEVRKTYTAFESNSRFAWGGLGIPFYAERESTTTRNELFGILNYQKDLSESIDLAMSAGVEIQRNEFKNYVGSTSGGLTTQGFYSLNTSVDRPNLSSRISDNKRQSAFAKASLGLFDGVLFLDGSARFDWSSTPDPENNRVETYGGSAALIFSKLLPQNNILSFGKLRASMAQAPLFPGTYAVSPVYNVATPYGSFGSMSIPSVYPNSALIGGVVEEFEIGTELKFLKNRIGLDVTYFNRVNDQLPSPVTLDGSTGYASVTTNEGKETSKGFEVALNLIPIRTDDFEYNLTFNIATLDRVVNKIANGTTINQLSTPTWGGLQLQARAGEQWGAIYGRKYRRDAAGNKVLSSTGIPRYDTNQYLGNVLPDFTGGMINNIRYKNFNLSFNLDFQSGGKFFSVTKMFNNYSGLGIETVGNNALGNPVRDPLTGGTSLVSVAANIAGSDSGGELIEGVDETTGAPASYYVRNSNYWKRLFSLHEEWIYDSSYIKLRTLRLDYSLPQDIADKTPFKRVNLGVFANNVWLISSDVSGIDPSEIELRNGINWTEGGQLPNVRTIGFNLKLTF